MPISVVLRIYQIDVVYVFQTERAKEAVAWGLKLLKLEPFLFLIKYGLFFDKMID